MSKGAARRWSIYKSDTNRMDVLQLLCFIVHERTKGALSLHLVWDIILYCWSCMNSVGGLADEPWVSMPLSWNGFTMPTHITFLCVRNLYKCTFDTPNHFATYIICMTRALDHANHTCMATQQSSARPCSSIV